MTAFDTRMRGYDMEQVDKFIAAQKANLNDLAAQHETLQQHADEIQADLDKLHAEHETQAKQVQDLTRENKRLTEENKRLHDKLDHPDADKYTRLGQEAQALIDAAGKEAETIRLNAKQEAEHTRQQAETKAEQVISTARKEADKTRENAKRDAELQARHAQDSLARIRSIAATINDVSRIIREYLPEPPEPPVGHPAKQAVKQPAAEPATANK